MLKNRLLLGLIFTISILAACEKPEVYNEEAQAAIDEMAIKKWLDSTKIDMIKDPSGLYYQIITAGTGTQAVELTDTLKVEYEGRLLTDSVFSRATEESPYSFVLGNSIPAWKIGLPMIKKGGQIRLLVPSVLAYRDFPVSGVPANSVVDFEIDLKEVKKKVDKQ